MIFVIAQCVYRLYISLYRRTIYYGLTSLQRQNRTSRRGWGPKLRECQTCDVATTAVKWVIWPGIALTPQEWLLLFPHLRRQQRQEQTSPATKRQGQPAPPARSWATSPPSAGPRIPRNCPRTWHGRGEAPWRSCARGSEQRSTPALTTHSRGTSQCNSWP